MLIYTLTGTEKHINISNIPIITYQPTQNKMITRRIQWWKNPASS